MSSLSTGTSTQPSADQASGIANFVHLRVHSEYSIADGLINVADLAAAAHHDRMPAVALTDRTNLFGLLKFYPACLGAGIKPLVGADLLYRHEQGEPLRIAVLAMNQEGYQNLIGLVSSAYLDGGERGMLTAAQIFGRQAGLLVLSGGIRGEIGRALSKADVNGALEIAQCWAENFPGRL